MTFNTVENTITKIMEKNEATRNDDMLLYTHYVYYKLPLNKCLETCALDKVFCDSRYRISQGIAPYETVSRIRRKVQEIRRDLRPTPAQLEEKYRAEKEYRKYAKGVKE